MSKIVTKKKVREYIRHKLSTSRTWQYNALIAIYNFQTTGEQGSYSSNIVNGIGFTGPDAEILTSFAKRRLGEKTLTNPKKFSDKQLAILEKKMKKYWRQIEFLCDKPKLYKCMFVDGWITKEELFTIEL